MVEVFSTNVCERQIADLLVIQIEQAFRNYLANFDLDDCDRVLRIKSKDGTVNIQAILDFISGFGYKIEVLPDTIIPRSVLFPKPDEESMQDFSRRSLL